ncbi:MAG: strawberry notch family protein, partial [Alphaproteobacteria bacterium]|nr:strawberry notch family protein [Alphaproteobacteria bacterium]
LADALPYFDQLPPRAEPVRRFSCSGPAIARPSPRNPTARRKVAATASIAAASSSPVPVRYRVLETPRQPEPVSEVYARYIPQRIEIEGAGAHPTPLVESLAMASVALPTPTHMPSLPARLITEGVLSAAQLETVIQASDAHDRFLPGFWSVNESGDGLIPMREGEGQAYRTGFFLGDGTGCGKGRQVAALILANFLAGRRRAVWLSMNTPLMEDAVRDWTAVGGAPTDIKSLCRWKPGEPVAMASGILFTTYATLRSQSQDGTTRLQQILDWLGEDFDGVIAFDEAHAMGNAAGSKRARGHSKGSRQGIAGLGLQNRLPKARILYVSATGATTVDNLAYASRLGLWGGLEAPFASREQFTDAMVSGGVAAMEVVARDLKALGLYVARSLSFEGVDYDIVEHALTAEQREIYDAYGVAFQVIHRNLGAALKATNVIDIDGKVNNGAAKSAAYSRFESVKQRFFSHIISGMKIPTLIRAIRADIEAGVSAVVQIVSIGEAMLDRRLASSTPEDMADLSIDLTPRDAVMTYLMDGFPVTLHRVVDTEDDKVTTEPVTDEHGQPVLSREAVAARDALIEKLALLAPIPTALDRLVWAFGPDAIAEVTGRSKRPVYKGEGQLRRLAIETRNAAAANTAETAAFQHGEKRILVFSGAGGTGRSYHADLEAQNQTRRHHYLLEPGWRADAAIQGLGRTHRSNQASAPLFRVVASDVAGEKRFTSTIARRLDTLGALTKGQRQTGGQGMFREEDNLEGVYASQALRGFYRTIARGEAKSIDLARFKELTALSLVDEIGVLLDELPPMSRLLNRLLAVDLDLQSAMLEELFGFIEARVEAARQAGTLDAGVETIRAECLTCLGRDVLTTCPKSGAETILTAIERRQRIKRLAAAELHATHHAGQPMRHDKTGKVALAVPARSLLTEEGGLVKQRRLIRPGSTKLVTEPDLEKSAWRKIGKSGFDRLWDEEMEALPEFSVDELHLLSGMLLPVWKLLPFDNQRVYRLELDDGTALLGRVFTKDEAGIVRARLKPTEAMDASSLLAAVLDEGRRIELAHGTTLNKRRIAGKPRLEIENVTSALIGGLKARGCFTEMIDWKLRAFVPLHEERAKTIPIIETILEVLPILAA